jgi:hypothetical protein
MTTHQRWLAINEEVCRIEELIGIEHRWTPESLEYRQALTLVQERKYRRALDNLERLIVQRLFELTKLGMSGVGMPISCIHHCSLLTVTGYKQREKIGKALKSRAVAIQRARKEYNECAGKLDPPRPKLSWTEVIEAASLAEFDLLRDTRQDIRQLPWAQPARREAMNLHFKIKGANDEILRLNVEIHRLLSFMFDDHADHYHAIAAQIIINPPLARELQVRWEYRQQINATIVSRLVDTSCLDDFSGQLLPGLREGRDPSLSTNVSFPWWVDELVLGRGSAAQGEDHDADVDGAALEVGHLTDFISNLTL